jgi:hypothetical protein
MANLNWNLLPFIYKEINSAFEIRLLRFEQVGLLINWSLDKVRDLNRLQLGSHFAAVSYCWGDSEPRYNIQIDGRKFGVSNNLWQFLNALPSHVQGNSNFPTYFWIDAISINQQNNQEKSNQVNIMRQIYSKAQCVLCCLGLSDQDKHTDMALDYTRAIRTSSFYLSSSRSPIIYKYIFDGLKDLLSRDYWRRIWIVQEVFLARDLQILCGYKMLEWAHFDFFISSEHIKTRPFL